MTPVAGGYEQCTIKAVRDGCYNLHEIPDTSQNRDIRGLRFYIGSNYRYITST